MLRETNLLLMNNLLKNTLKTVFQYVSFAFLYILTYYTFKNIIPRMQASQITKETHGEKKGQEVLPRGTTDSKSGTSAIQGINLELTWKSSNLTRLVSLFINSQTHTLKKITV